MNLNFHSPSPFAYFKVLKINIKIFLRLKERHTYSTFSFFLMFHFFVFRFRGKEIAAASAKDCRQSEIKYIEGATHWVNQECPEQVNNYIHEFLRA